MHVTTPILEHPPVPAAPETGRSVLDRLWEEAERQVAEIRVPQPPVPAELPEPAGRRVRFNRD